MDSIRLRARERLATNTVTVDSYAEFKERLDSERGFLLAHWCGSAECEQAIKAETGATIRCIPLEGLGDESGMCICDGRPSPSRVIFARAY